MLKKVEVYVPYMLFLPAMECLISLGLLRVKLCNWEAIKSFYTLNTQNMAAAYLLCNFYLH